MKKHVFCVFFLIFLALTTCTILSQAIERETTLEVIGYEKKASYDAFSMPPEMLFTDENGSHLYEVYEGTGWESGLRAREILLDGSYFIADRDYTIVRGASRQPVYGELAALFDGKDTAPSTYVAWYPNGIPAENEMLFQAEILEQSSHVLLLHQEKGIIPFTENRAKGSMAQLAGPNWRVYNLEALDQLLNSIPNSLLAIVLVAAVAVLGILVCIFSYHPRRNRWLILTNCITITAVLFFLTRILNQIDLPASMLPPENIFDISYYRAELAGLYHALEELASGTTKTYVELRGVMVQKGNRILISGGIVIGCIGLLELLYIWHIATRKPKYQGKYLSTTRK